MFAITTLRRQSLKTLSSLLCSTVSKDGALSGELSWKSLSRHAVPVSSDSKSCSFYSNGREPGSSRWMSSAPRGRSMRSKVEKRMQREAGKTLKEIRRAKRLKLKLMTEEERLVHQLRRAKKKVALLLQKLKKYELPELPSPKHDPELFTSEQLQAFKKIGFRNKNYVPVGVRGVFGGVVQNMHLHWKFHETVQVCCDNFPKEKIKEMATMIARLSGGIVVNIHNVKTIIMFRGRNYRQPKNLIPINTLTKRKALFKARFEQALESQKLNIKKTEQQLRRKGVNPEDPAAMASIQRVASTFFNAIDQKEGSPYVFRDNEKSKLEPEKSLEQSEPVDDSEDEDLDKFIAEIEDAADKEWAAEEAAEKEEGDRIRYLNKEDSSGRFVRPERVRESDFDNGMRGGVRTRKDVHEKKRTFDSDEEEDLSDGSEEEWESDEESKGSGFQRCPHNVDAYRTTSRIERGNKHQPRGPYQGDGFKRQMDSKSSRKMAGSDSDSEELLSDLENTIFESDEENHLRTPRSASNAYSQFERQMNKGAGRRHDSRDSDDGSDGEYFKPSIYRDRGGKHDKFGRGNTHDISTNSRLDKNERGSEAESEAWESDDSEDMDSSALKAAEDDYKSFFGETDYGRKAGNVNGKLHGKKGGGKDGWESD